MHSAPQLELVAFHLLMSHMGLWLPWNSKQILEIHGRILDSGPGKLE